MTGKHRPKAPGANRQGEVPSENKEKGYIAASRRADRSIEARIKSTETASRIHFERTEKHLKITEETVRKEEKYKEEDDHLPLAYHNA